MRKRFETLRDQLDAFEKRVFEQTFTSLTAESNKRVPEDSLLQRIAKQFAISPSYVDDIYTAHGEEIQRRLDERERAHNEKLKAEQDALEKRCGALPTSAWAEVNRYAQSTFAAPHVEIVLGECMTPLLTERNCWEMHCSLKTKEEVSVERPKIMKDHEITFYLKDNRVIGNTGD